MSRIKNILNKLLLRFFVGFAYPTQIKNYGWGLRSAFFVQLENARTNSYYAPPATPGQQRQYIVRSGDTLWGIAQRELGNGNRWREIQKPGGGTFTEAEAGQLQVGQSVYLPVNYQSGSGTSVTPPPSSAPSTSGNINWVNFSGTVGPSNGVNLRNSTRFSDRSPSNEPYNKRLEFDGWTYGETVTDLWLGTPDARWFKVKGTNFWVPSAYIYGNPPNSSPMPGSGAVGSVTIGGTPEEDVKSDNYLIVAGVKRLYEDRKRYEINFPVDYNDLVESWFGEDPEGWSNDDMIANYKGITFAQEHGDLLNKAWENFKASVQNYINAQGISIQKFIVLLLA
jgi:hypothetical protein